MRLIFLILLIPLNSFAQTVTVTCDPPTEREDNTPLTSAEIQGFYAYFSDGVSGTYPNKTALSTTCQAVIPQLDIDRHAVMTTVDTDGRESAYSNEALIPALAALVQPSTISNFAVNYTGGNTYQLSWSLPTTNVDGTPLAPAEISKLFLFELSSDGSIVTWLQDIPGNQTTLDLVLTPGVTHYAIEVERKVGTQTAVSAKSSIVSVIVLAFPKPPIVN